MSLQRGQLILTYHIGHALCLCCALWLSTVAITFAQALPSGAISGRLIVPPDIALETEPNDDIASAQVMTATPSVIGESSANAPGFILSVPGVFVKVEDLYRIQTTSQTKIILTIAAEDLFMNDLDLVLLDLDGNLLDISEGFVSTEILDVPAGDFIVAIRTLRGASAYLLVAQSAVFPTPPPLLPTLSTAPFRPGEVVVKRRPSKLGSSRNAQRFARAYGFRQSVVAPNGVTLLKHVDTPAARAANAQGHAKLGLAVSPQQRLKVVTLDTIRRLQLDPEVVYAEPNYILQALRVPNDEYYGLQWHYELINLPEAWDLSIGDATIIVAVIDSGVLRAHPDLSPRLIDGFDLISDPFLAEDGDGIDPIPVDPGDDPRGESSTFHGTHVAGTVGAATNNRIGGAGVTWQTRIMPVRVLGLNGEGTSFDIAQGIRYVAGLPNASGVLPPERAHIINLSLGGPGLSQVIQDAITAARVQDVAVVAAAGNDNTSGIFSPASLNGVIAVTAVDLQSAKAPYANFGAWIDVAAPGGYTRADLNNDSLPDGVLSTLGTDSGAFTVAFYHGTSMAAPHLSGVLALMLAVNPDLTPDDFDQLLAGTHALTPQRITRDLGPPGRDDIYGHGLIDAAAAVNVASSLAGSVTLPPTGSVLAVSTPWLNLERFRDTASFEITNAGVDALNISSITADVPWLSITPTVGAAPLLVTVTVDRAALAPGVNAGKITVISDATRGETTAIVSVQAISQGVISVDAGPIVVLAIDAATGEVASEVITNPAQDYAYTLADVPAGQYFVVAGTDLDEDFLICDIEDICGFFPDSVIVSGGQDVTDVDLILGALSSPQAAKESAASVLGRPIPRHP